MLELKNEIAISHKHVLLPFNTLDKVCPYVVLKWTKTFSLCKIAFSLLSSFEVHAFKSFKVSHNNLQMFL